MAKELREHNDEIAALSTKAFQFATLRNMFRSLYLAIVSLAFCSLVYPWFVGIMVSGDLIDVSGRQAQQRLNYFWPSDLQNVDLSNFSIQTRLGTESQETFMGMSCSPKVALSWRTFLRAQYELKLKELDEDLNRVIEVRTIEAEKVTQVGSLRDGLSHPSIGVVPAWWKPSGNEFTAYQAMAWYKKISDPISRSYSIQYDFTSNRLWICLVSYHQDPLWKRGEGSLLSEAEKKPAGKDEPIR